MINNFSFSAPKFSQRHDLHLLRKLWHFVMGALGVFFFLYFKIEGEDARWWGACLIIVGIMGFIFEQLRLHFDQINKLFCRWFSLIMRQEEEVKMSGFTFYVFGIGLLLLFFSKNLALLCASYLIIADPLASVAGILFGRTRILKNRSMEGSMTFFFLCLIINISFYALGLWPFMQLPIWILFFAAMLVSLIEILTTNIVDDNLAIPFFSALALSSMNYLLIH